MANDNAIRKWLACQLDEERFNAFWRMASEMGLHPSIVLERAALEYIRTMGKNSKNSDVYIAAQLIESEGRTNRINSVKKIAYAYLEDPTEEGADQLRAVCELAGVTMETVVDEINKSPNIKELLKETGTLSDVEMWVLKKMEVGKTYPVNDILNEAKKAGHSPSKMKEIKKRLRIESERDGDHWVWVIRPNIDPQENDLVFQ